MQVLFKASQRRPSLPVVYQPGRVKFCCASMSRWWGVLIGFGARGCAASTCRDVCLYLDRPQASGGTVLKVVPVEFCPFCGEVIEACRVK